MYQHAAQHFKDLPADTNPCDAFGLIMDVNIRLSQDQLILVVSIILPVINLLFFTIFYKFDTFVWVMAMPYK